MPSRQLPEAIMRAAVQSSAEGADADLLGRFVTARDPGAFAELVRRHGPMVLGVCRRSLGNTPDADDAFQAVWLVLVRKATSISPRGAVGNWLYGVATRTAAHARCATARRRIAQRELPDVPDPKPHNSDAPEIASVIDAELAHLPDKYRSAVVLCELEGRSLKETAEQLGVPVGTIASRLARGRALLAERLKAKGFAASVLVGAFASATVPVSARLHDLAVALLTTGPQELARPVSEIARGVLSTMFAEKLKVTGKWLAALALGVGAVVWVASAGAQPTQPIPTPKSETGKADPPPPVEGNPFAGRLDPRIPRRPAEEVAWDRLTLDDPDASRAVLDLVAMPKEAVALFAKKLQPLKIDKVDVKKLIADLESEKVDVRETAYWKLHHFDPRLAMDPAEAFAEAKTQYAKQRLVELLLDPSDLARVNAAGGPHVFEVTSPVGRGPRTFTLSVIDAGRRGGPTVTYPIAHRVSDIRRPSWTRDVRAVVILERIGTPEAQAVLQTVAEGHPDALATQTAKAALDRLNPKAP